jgi:hypothetical protein
MQDIGPALFGMLLAASIALDLVPSLRLRTRVLLGLPLTAGALAAMFLGVRLPVGRTAADILFWISLAALAVVLVASAPKLLADFRAGARE